MCEAGLRYTTRVKKRDVMTSLGSPGCWVFKALLTFAKTFS